MKKTLFLLLFFNLAFFSYSQTSYKSGRMANSKDSLARYRFEVGTDLLWLVDKNSLPGYCLQLKVNTNSKKHPGAFRFSFGVNLKTKDSTNVTGSIDDGENYNSRTSTFYFRQGYQLTYSFNRLKLFWGADLHLSYYQFFEDYYWRLILMNNAYYKCYFTRTYTRLQVGFVGVVGASYSITHKMSISFESNCSILYSMIKNRGHSYYKEFPYDGNRDDWYNSNNMIISTIPISTISINVNF
ncbi:MAG: hypothetical protein HOO91_04290 [Bacteroidales bacterium]|nr:hypothetical protein [Bacteroidales bacterium]